MKPVCLLAIVGVLAVVGCGGDDETSGTQRSTGATVTRSNADVAATKNRPDKPARAKRRGTKITVGESQFGAMLFSSKKQAIYIFEKDSADKSVCYGECAQAWPPVFTDGEPVADKGVRRSLLGSVKRRDGKLQVTYAGKPLYYYVNEGPGEVRCHNVNLNGGLWWVVGPNGKRLA